MNEVGLYFLPLHLVTRLPYLFPRSYEVIFPLEVESKMVVDDPRSGSSMIARWLNVVFNLNDIPYMCKEFCSRDLKLMFNDSSLSYTPT